MIIFFRGNASKQWIMSELHQRQADRRTRVLDLGCGDAIHWSNFLASHPNIAVDGIDFDGNDILRGQAFYKDAVNMTLRKADAQESGIPPQQYDVVTAFSVMEHVRDHRAFVRTVWQALASGGVAYLNYDAGHFRTPTLQERFTVPLSQLLAWVGYERPYMKKVNNRALIDICEKQGFTLTHVHKHHLYTLKKLMRGVSDEVVESWFGYEDHLNAHFSPDALDSVMWSTTLVIKKP